MDKMTDLPSRLRRLTRRLEVYYGKPSRPQLDPVDELILTVLSQNTSDVNSHRAFSSLKSAFRAWEEVLEAPVGRIVDLIRAGGLAEVKGPRIQQIIKETKEREGSINLGRLCSLPLEEAERYLTSLPGVGPKTAACVLLFSLELPAFPVDTHVLRVAKRLAIIPRKASAEEAHRILGAAVDPDDALSLHLNLVRHGRTLCKAQRPRCADCPLLDESPYGQLQTRR